MPAKIWSPDGDPRSIKTTGHLGITSRVFLDSVDHDKDRSRSRDGIRPIAVTISWILDGHPAIDVEPDSVRRHSFKGGIHCFSIHRLAFSPTNLP